MAHEPLAVLKDIAKQSGRRVSGANLFDANVCTSPLDPEHPWEILALPGDFFRHKLTINRRNRKTTLLANGDFIRAQVSGDFDVDAYSINRRDKVMQFEQSLLHVPGFPTLPVYSRQSDTDLRQFLNSTTLNQALDTLQLRENESLHIYRNGLVLYLQRGSRDEIMSAVEAACKLTEQLPASKDSLDLGALPAKFENLSDLIRKWALSDDEERSEMLAEKSLRELRVFVATVSPFIPAIDEYLDSFRPESPPMSAVALGTLAECCLEAQVRIRDLHHRGNSFT
jgi:hypothetical protein